MSDLHPNHPSAEAPGGAEDEASHLAFVAHEVRNPLATALWSVEILARMTPEERGAARGEKLARMSLRALNRLRRLVEDHLLSARLDAGGISFDSEEIPARELFPSASTVGAGSLELELETGLSVVGDAALCRRVVEAALLSAARSGADVRVSGARKGGVARFRVSGAPVTVQDLEDPRRGHPGDTRGAALALGMARRACALLGGAIRVEDGSLVVELPAPEARRRQG